MHRLQPPVIWQIRSCGQINIHSSGGGHPSACVMYIHTDEFVTGVSAPMRRLIDWCLSAALAAHGCGYLSGLPGTGSTGNLLHMPHMLKSQRSRSSPLGSLGERPFKIDTRSRRCILPETHDASNTAWKVTPCLSPLPRIQLPPSTWLKLHDNRERNAHRCFIG